MSQHGCVPDLWAFMGLREGSIVFFHCKGKSHYGDGSRELLGEPAEVPLFKRNPQGGPIARRICIRYS